MRGHRASNRRFSKSARHVNRRNREVPQRGGIRF